MDLSNRSEAGTGSSNRATRIIGGILAALGLVAVLTWAVSIFFGIALVKSLAAVVLVLFLIVVALLVAGVT